MKTRVYPLLILIIFLFSCSQQTGKQEPETLGNLKTAIEGEITANAKYLVYAEKARQDSMPEIAALFHAAAVAEKAHADREITMLLAHGGTLKGYHPEFPAYSIQDNLRDAIKVENYEAEDMYPGFKETSHKEGLADVTETFNWALQAEIKHRDLFRLALKSLDDPSVELPKAYMVCPRCGNTMDAAHYSDPCDICENEASKFVEVK